ncbi:50S ribosomal protein L22 [Patescibacteria group bacterium]|nr:50S ribosomal protein L22 [Patescibacteria group bacterium]
MKATLKNYRQSPRKVRLIADLVRGKSVDHALNTLSFIGKKAADPVKKLITSALANAKQTTGSKSNDLIIKSIQVDKGFVFKRFQARARGRAAPIRKRTSHVSVMLGEKEKKVDKKAVSKQSVQKEVAVKIKTPAVKKRILPKKLKASAKGGKTS